MRRLRAWWRRLRRRPLGSYSVTLTANTAAYTAGLTAATSATFMFWSWRARPCIAEMDPDEWGDQA